MKKRKAAALDSSLLVRKGEAAPSVFSAAEPARPAWPVEPEPSAAAGPATTSDTPVPTAAEAAVARADTTAAMERIRNAMTRGPSVPFRQRGAAANDPIDLAAVKQARAEGGLADGTATAGRLASRHSRKAKRRVALTLRLEPERHLRLKIFAAYTERSIQNVLSCALDDYLERVAATDDCACLGVHQAPGTRYGGKE